MRFFVTIKHWQLFTIVVGPSVVFNFVFMASIISSPGSNTFYAFPVMMIAFLGTFFAWMYTLGVSLHSRLPAGVGVSLFRFKLFMAIPALYMVGILGFMALTLSGGLVGTVQEPTAVIIAMAIIMPLHLFSMFCMFHTLYFCTKCLKAVELQRDVEFSDYAGEFMLLWFFPIGIWIIQPRINKLFA